MVYQEFDTDYWNDENQKKKHNEKVQWSQCSCELLLLMLENLLLLAPLVLFAHLLFLSSCEVILDVECFANFLGNFALDHVGYGLAGDVKETLDVQVIGWENQLEKCTLVNLMKKKIMLALC